MNKNDLIRRERNEKNALSNDITPTVMKTNESQTVFLTYIPLSTVGEKYIVLVKLQKQVTGQFVADNSSQDNSAWTIHI